MKKYIIPFSSHCNWELRKTLGDRTHDFWLIGSSSIRLMMKNDNADNVHSIGNCTTASPPLRNAALDQLADWSPAIRWKSFEVLQTNYAWLIEWMGLDGCAGSREVWREERRGDQMFIVKHSNAINNQITIDHHHHHGMESWWNTLNVSCFMSNTTLTVTPHTDLSQAETKHRRLQSQQIHFFVYIYTLLR